MTLADGRNVARWNDPLNGKLRQEGLDRLGLTTQRKREQWAIGKSDELKALRLAGSLAYASPEPMSVDEGLAAYALAKPVADRTAQARKPSLDEFAQFCRERGIKRLDQLTAPKLWPWRDLVVGNGARKESTRNLWLASVAAFLRWAATRDLVPLLPVDKIKALTKRIEEPEHEIEVLQPSQIRQVLEAAIESDAKSIRQRRPVAGFVMTTLLSGMRFSEVAELDWSEVADDGIRLPASRTKNRRSRTITFRESPSLAAFLGMARGGREQGLVFDPIWHPQVWRDHQARLIDSSGVGFTPHVLRRTCGSIIANSAGIAGSASVWHAAQRLGHSVAVAERHYLGLLSDLPVEAGTIEDAVQIRDLCQRIVEDLQE